MHEQFGTDDLFERRAERLDQLGGQVAHETDRVGQHERPAVGELSTARGRFERGEQRVLDQYTRTGQSVEQAGLAGVGVADDCHRRDVAGDAATALGVADLLHRANVAAQLGHSFADAAAVGLDLGLTRAAGTHPTAGTARAAAGLPRHRLAPAAQSGQHVLHLGQRHLRLAFAAGRVLGEDVEDQRGPVDDLDLDDLLQRGELGRAEFTVADDGVRARGGDDVAQFGGFTGADIGGRVGPVATLDHAFEHLGACSLGQRRQLGEAGVGVGGAAVGPHADEHDAFQTQLAVLDLGDVGQLRRQAGHPAQCGAVVERQLTGAGGVVDEVGMGHRRIKVRTEITVHAPRLTSAGPATIPGRVLPARRARTGRAESCWRR